MAFVKTVTALASLTVLRLCHADCPTKATAAKSACPAVGGTDLGQQYTQVCEAGDCKTKLEAMNTTCTGVASPPAFLTTYNNLDLDLVCGSCGRMATLATSEMSACVTSPCTGKCKDAVCCSEVPSSLPESLKTAAKAVKSAAAFCTCSAGSAGSASDSSLNLFVGVLVSAAAVQSLSA